ncbi:UDP-2,4-diacetamido-2,4,6-trideoxy-beta-L-altropyranose hydrolase [Thermogemmatispora sp.]|uniref:UDP-2,4-diacetamido-2,4, 6-trideoxy-beta-L-altropyranose hydrolase n=1 Tax=Thermogemmatispora sp. TaxID=1968838 RepID=UPI0035E44009
MTHKFRKLFIRADANAQLGAGHLMRCLAIGQAWKDSGGEVVFISSCQNKILRQRLINEGFHLFWVKDPHPNSQDIQQTLSIIAAFPDEWFVLDGYHFDTYYQRCIKEAGFRLLVIDDLASFANYHADIIVNQNLHAKNLKYRCDPATLLLLGEKYILLRREFRKWRRWKRGISEKVQKILLTLGGGATEDLFLKIIGGLNGISNEHGRSFDIRAVLGHDISHKISESSYQDKIRVEFGVAGSEMPDLMAWADLAITSAGVTAWEVMFMGLPSGLITLADNQRPTVRELSKRGIAIDLKLGEQTSGLSSTSRRKLSELLNSKDEDRLRMSHLGRELVDGEGVDRLLMHMKGERLRLREVEEGDCKLLWEWANDPEVRAASFSQRNIPWDEHVEWFQRKISDPNYLMYIGVDKDDSSIGLVRFSIRKKVAEISVAVDKSKRGLGYGSSLIKSAVEKACQHKEIDVVRAYIKPSNLGSIRAFEKAGFRKIGTVVRKEQIAVQYLFER